MIANLSFVGSRALRNGVEHPDERILVSEVMPDPNDTTRPLIRRFRDAMMATHGESEDHLIEMTGSFASNPARMSAPTTSD